MLTMKKFFRIFVIVCLIGAMPQVAFAEDEKPGLRDLFSFKVSTKGSKTVVGVLTDLTSNSLTIRTEDGKETTYVLGLGLKLPKGVEKSSIVTIQVNEKLKVVKSVSPTMSAKHKIPDSKMKS